MYRHVPVRAWPSTFRQVIMSELANFHSYFSSSYTLMEQSFKCMWTVTMGNEYTLIEQSFMTFWNLKNFYPL